MGVADSISVAATPDISNLVEIKRHDIITAYAVRIKDFFPEMIKEFFLDADRKYTYLRCPIPSRAYLSEIRQYNGVQ